MGLDGFAMGNLGLGTDMTSAQMANQSEHIAKKESQIKIKDIEESANKQGVKRKTEGDEEETNNHFKGSFKNKDGTEDENQYKSILSEKNIENTDLREFSVRINPKTDLIELFNTKNEKVLEIISAEDLMALMSRLNDASGILVNRKI